MFEILTPWFSPSEAQITEKQHLKAHSTNNGEQKYINL